MYMMFFHMTKTKHFDNWMKLAKVKMVEVYLPCDVKCDLVCCYVRMCVCAVFQGLGSGCQRIPQGEEALRLPLLQWRLSLNNYLSIMLLGEVLNPVKKNQKKFEGFKNAALSMSG